MKNPMNNKSGQISRRDFLKVLGVAGGASLLAGCGGAAPCMIEKR